MRIIAGSARGRTIQTIPGVLTRPTLDRVKESVFGIIQFEIIGRSVLDLFAGSGGMGLETISRGAKSAVFIDNNFDCTKVITSNVDMLKFGESCVVQCANYESALKMFLENSMRFDIVFLDPPYTLGILEDVINMLVDYQLLNKFGLIIAEHSAKHALPKFDLLSERCTRQYGKVAVSIFELLEDYE